MTDGFSLNLIQQRSIKVYSFVMTADDLLTYAKVDRFDDSPDGVNRVFDHGHALRIAEAMLEPTTVMLDAICGDLRGEWTIEGGKLVPGPGAYLSIDDGQHRHAACSILTSEERPTGPSRSWPPWGWTTRRA